MATLTSIGYTLGGGFTVFTVTIACFSAAVYKRNIFVAGRCVARPKEVIYNPNPKDPCQDRGKTVFGWFQWAMSLSYDTLLDGVPGTGTREEGLKGHMLKVNLDGIVIMRYHNMGLKLSFFGSILYLFIIMPMYTTARCSFLQGDLDTPECTNATLTDYEQVTLHNVRSLEPYEDPNSIFMAWFDVLNRQNMGRLYAVAVCTWLVTWYAMKLLHMEWLDILAMRRVYYLEADHWKDRMEELNNVAEEQNKQDVARIEKRAVYVPHPELRDTVPNIELYSILVGGLPSLPTDAVEDIEAVFSRKQSMDWQLSVTTAFFDHCVPNQPGFSSSVAAVTILPAAKEITAAWQQWYKAAAKVRKLRFIRERIKILREAEGNERDSTNKSDTKTGPGSAIRQPSLMRRISLHHDDILGSQTDIEVEDHLFHALDLGPEQTAVYGREFALGAAGFAPHGWFEWRIANAGMKELLVMEEQAARSVQHANVELQEARDRIANKSSGDDESFASLASAEFKSTGDRSQRGLAPNRQSGNASERSPVNNKKPASAPNLDSESLLQEAFAPNLAEDVAAVTSSITSKQSMNSSTRDDTASSIGPSSASVKSNRSKLSRASMAQLPTALGLEAGLWTEQDKLGGSSQAIPRIKKARPGRTRCSAKADTDETAKNYYSDIAKMKSRTNDTSDRTITKRNSFDDEQLIKPSSRIERPSLKKAVTTGTPDIDRGNVSTLLKNILETGEGADVRETEGMSSESFSDNSVSPERRDADGKIERRNSPGSAAMWKSLEQESVRVRARLSKIKVAEDAEDAEDNPVSRNNEADAKQVNGTLRVIIPEQENGDEDNGPAPTTPTMLENDAERDILQDVTPGYGTDWSIGGVEEMEENLDIAYNFEQRAGLRKRENVGSQEGEYTEKWGKVMSIVEETAKDMNGENSRKRVISNGRWVLPSFQSMCRGVYNRMFKRDNFQFKSPELLNELARDSTYAVVTFTSRQAAVAARHCLADARGADRWVNLRDLPIPPLSDAPVCSASCRPVTLGISDSQKKVRRFINFVCLAIVYFFYTIPLTAVQNMVSEEKLSKVYPEISQAKETNPIMANILLGLIPALIWILFFAVCPPLFKFIASFGSTATSTVEAENSALRYFWGFMLLSAFTGDAFQRAVINGFSDGIRIGSELQILVENTAKRIPVQVSSNWLNWIIARMFVVLPTQYLLQTNTFLFTWLGWRCCQRAVSGGGAGPPIPYRIYVDSGVVLLCLFALAPASPLIAPAACMYFLISLPLLRWTMIFLYKPKFDVGGGRFPFIFDVCVSAMLVGQILLMTMMLLKGATGPAIAAIIPFLPTIFYRFRLRTKYLKAFSDAALLQTSLLDGWDNEDDATDEEREEFRKFLVDCHKAAYVPVCIASGESRTLITAEPAVVIPMDENFVDEEMIANNSSHNLSEDSVTDSMRPQPALSTWNLRTYKTATVGARVPLTPRTKMVSPKGRIRKPIEEGAMPSLPNLPFQPGASIPQSPVSSPTTTKATFPVGERRASLETRARRASLGSSARSRHSLGSSRRFSGGAAGGGNLDGFASPGGGRRASLAGMRPGQSVRGADMLLLSPQASRRGMMVRRMSRTPRMSTNHAGLPTTPELPFDD